MKTAISIPDSLFEAIQKLAHDQQQSRSELFAQALREYLERRQNHHLLKTLNQVYQSPDTKEEQELKEKSRRYHGRHLRQGQEW